MCLAIRRKTKDMTIEVVDFAYRALPNAVNKGDVDFEGKASEGLVVMNVGGKTVPDTCGDGAAVAALCGDRSSDKEKRKN